MANLIETLDRIHGIYAPLLVRMMVERPDFAGIRTVLREEDPRAYPTANVPPGYADGYSDDAFEAPASQALVALVGPTYEAIRACKPVSDRDRPLSVWAKRRLSEKKKALKPKEGITVTSSLSSGLGGVNAVREAVCMNPQGCFLLLPASLTITTQPRLSSRQIAEMTAAAEIGLKAVADYLESNRLLLNWSADHDARLSQWVASFPDPAKVKVEEFGDGIFRLHTSSRFGSRKLLVSEAYAAETPEIMTVFESFTIESIASPYNAGGLGPTGSR